MIKIITRLSFLFFLFISFQVYSQDTLTIMHYNLLFYGNTGPTPCNLLTPVQKNPHLRVILDYTQPDIFGVNELGNDDLFAQNILLNTLNVSGVTKYKRATYSNSGNESIVNTIFYNSEKLTLKSQKIVSSVLRDINAYKLYYNHSSLASTQDTTFIIVMVAHLKAGSTSGDQATRASETILVRNYLNTLPAAQNVFFMGDLNIQSSSETSYVHLTNQTIKPFRNLVDPINSNGSWNNNSLFSGIHTQSTRANSSCDGGAPGGSDDRLDFILCSKAIKEDSSRVKYLTGTYKTVGQDGLHFNQALNSSPLNTTVPANVLNALFNMSDHLPVLAKFQIRAASSVGLPSAELMSRSFTVQNPINQEIKLWSSENFNHGKMKILLYSIEGKLILENEIPFFNGEYSISLENKLNSGLYMLVIQPENGISIVKKIVSQSN